VELYKSIFTENEEWRTKHRRRFARLVKKFVVRRRKLAQSIREMSNLSAKMFDSLIAELKIKALFNVVILFVIVFVGSGIIANIEDLPIKEAIYLCVVTICTVGYGDVVPVTNAGKLFIIFYQQGPLTLTRPSRSSLSELALLI